MRNGIFTFLCLWVWLATAGCSHSLPPPTPTAIPAARVTAVTRSPTQTPLPPAPPPTLTPLPTATLSPTPTATPTSVPSPTATATPEPIRFAVIGDYGSGWPAAQDVAELVKSWQPDFIITTGDNNYPSGQAETIDQNIGRFYHEFIHPYQGEYGPGADTNRFFPVPGNHDWDTPDLQPYLDYFTLPGNERYYDFVWGPVHFFALSSDWRESDGIRSNSIQAAWLQAALANSAAPWQVVYLHLPPYSSGHHGSIAVMRWPFAEWGADAVLAGHDHHYERLLIDGIPYFINGLGGGARYAIGDPVPGSEVHFGSEYGAMLVEASDSYMTFQFITRAGDVIDTSRLTR